VLNIVVDASIANMWPLIVHIVTTQVDPRVEASLADAELTATAKICDMLMPDGPQDPCSMAARDLASVCQSTLIKVTAIDTHAMGVACHHENSTNGLHGVM
jgi:hypothetical protein